MTDSPKEPDRSNPLWGFGTLAEVDNAIGRVVRRSRERRQMSQRFVVDELNSVHKLGWHQTTLAKTEAGERPIRFSEALALADVLDLSVTALSPVLLPGQLQSPEALLRARAMELGTLGRDIEYRRKMLLDMADHEPIEAPAADE